MTTKKHYMIFPIAILLFLACISTTFSFTGKLIEDTSEKELIIAKTVQYLKEKKVNTSEEKMKALANSVYKESQEYDIDYRLILAVVKVESNFNNEAISRRGARGLMQIRPSSAKGIARESGVEVKGAKCLHEPEKNIKIGVSYLSKLQGMFDNMVSALHAYNAGPSKVKKADPVFGAKTTAFTRKVMNEYQQIIEVLPDPEE
jgi:soluble lytic murein transglycosylase